MENFLSKCEKHLSVLCYVCGLFTPKSKQVKLSNNTKISESYKNRFNININEAASYTPKQICTTCYTMLREQRKYRNVPVTPMVWQKPDNQHSNCYACLIPSYTGFNWSTRKHVKYPDYPTTNSRRPVFVTKGSATELDQQPQSESDLLPEPQPGPSNAQLEPSFQPISLVPTSSLSSQSSGEYYIPP